VNIILFEPAEIGRPLGLEDHRAVHLTEVLRRKEGDRFDAGIVNGPRGKGTVTAIGPEGVQFRFEPVAAAGPADPIHLLVALPRPQTGRKILSEATSLGVASIRFFPADKGEPSYATSSLWKTAEWRRHLVDGAAQAFDTRLPDVAHFPGLAEAIDSLPAGCLLIALDNYEATRRMVPVAAPADIALAFGPERGWSPPERNLLRVRGFEIADLGGRVLRTETAVVAAVSVAKATPRLTPGA
jgi:16S rRNA (uracil1498-N3)-methyltransferase